MAFQLIAKSRVLFRKSLCFVLLNKSHVNTPTLSPVDLSRFQPNPTVKPPPFMMMISNSIATLLMQRSYITKSRVSFSQVVKEVCSLNLKTLTVAEYEIAMEKISWRFPLVDPVLGSGMRRTVRRNEFHFSRSFLFIKLGFDEVGYFSLLVSTETTKLVGVKRNGSLVVFDRELLSQKSDVCKVAEVEEIYPVDFKIKLRDDVSYMFPCEEYFHDAVKSLVELLDCCESSTLNDRKLDHYQRCLVFLYMFAVRGVVFSWTKWVVKYYLVPVVTEGIVVTAGTVGGLSFETLISDPEWESMSTAWHRGLKVWTSNSGLKCVIEDEVSIVMDKASPKDDDTSKFNEKSMYEREFEDRLRDFSPCKQAFVLAAWNAAKAGYDETEFFHEAGYERLLAELKKNVENKVTYYRDEAGYERLLAEFKKNGENKVAVYSDEAYEFWQNVAEEARKAFKDAVILYFG